jgi:bacteriorhodopsin
MKVSLALFALATAATAQDSTQDSTQGADDSQGADTTQQAGYEAETPAESYGEYGAEPGYMPAPTVCLEACPVEAPCKHPSGGCVQKACTAAPVATYGAPVQSYGGVAQQGGYRMLQQGYGQQQQSYGEAQTYGAPVAMAAPAQECGCPAGTVDTSGDALTKNWPLWVGFALLFLPALWFMCVMFEDLTDDGEINGSNTWRQSMGMHRIVAGFICMFASLAYLTMATGHGYIVRCCDGRSFYYARYIDWTITTPLMIWELASLARASYNDTLFLIFLDILMIISGLIGALVCSGEKWAFFGFSILCFIPILTSLCQWDRAAQLLKDGGKVNENLGEFTDARLRRYRTAMNITVITWFFYPIVWIFAEGTGKMTAYAEAICYTALDVIAKSVFGFVIVYNLREGDVDIEI